MRTTDLSAPSRRRFLQSAAAWSAGVWLSRLASAQVAGPARLIETKVISRQPELYHGWPTIARRRNGELWVVCSGGREEHVCPFGQVVAMTSRDEGTTWSHPRVLYDGPLDDRDAGVVETAQGTLLVTTFTSLAYEARLTAEEKKGSWPVEKLAEWRATRDFLTPDQRRASLGEWVLRSTDGGITWSAPLPTVVNSPHGPIALKDGRLLYPGKQLWTEDKKIGVCESKDDGRTWQWLAEIPTRPGDSATRGYHELHGVEAANGTLIVQIRNHNDAHKGETLQTESTDGGRHWSVPHSIGVWGLPSHLVRLRDDRLVMTYGHRRPPFGNQARVSGDHGRTWGEPVILSGDGLGGDLGYPSTVQLGNGTLLTVWYERLKDSPRAVLRQARWTLSEHRA